MSQVGRSAYVVEPIPQRQLMRKGDLVDRVAPVKQRLGGLKAVPCPGIVEVLGFEERGDLGQSLWIDQDGADNRFLGV